MRTTRIWITLGCCLLAVSAWGQSGRKPGLWEMTTNMTWQKSPFPSNAQMPPQAAAAFSGGPRTTQVCLTQAWIDRYGAPVPQSHGGCQVTNVSLKLTGMTADMVCTGHLSGRGTVESDWSMGDTARGKVHFTGTMQMGPNATPIEWTVESTSVYKGPDCGSVQPMAPPKE